MAESTTDLRRELDKNLDRLRTLRDEIRVRLHLAGMDAKSEWNKLEPRVLQVETEITRTAGEVSDTSRTALRDIVGKVQKLRDALH